MNFVHQSLITGSGPEGVAEEKQGREGQWAAECLWKTWRVGLCTFSWPFLLRKPSLWWQILEAMQSSGLCRPSVPCPGTMWKWQQWHNRISQFILAFSVFFAHFFSPLDAPPTAFYLIITMWTRQWKGKNTHHYSSLYIIPENKQMFATNLTVRVVEALKGWFLSRRHHVPGYSKEMSVSLKLRKTCGSLLMPP